MRDGANSLFTPQFKQALVRTARQTHQHRTNFLEALEEEAISISEAHRTLCDLITHLEQQTHDGSMTIPATEADAITMQLDTLVEDRQHRLHRHTQLGTTSGRDLCSYLYHEEEWTCPVLEGAAILGDVVDSRRQ